MARAMTRRGGTRAGRACAQGGSPLTREEGRRGPGVNPPD